jgi:hypothetical protein
MGVAGRASGKKCLNDHNFTLIDKILVQLEGLVVTGGDRKIRCGDGLGQCAGNQ